MPAGQDKYANVILQTCTMSAANTLTFSEVNIGLSTFDRIGMLVSRLEYMASSTTYQELTSGADIAQVGLVGSDQVTSIGSTTRGVYDKTEWTTIPHGTPASADILVFPVIKDLSGLPGGGLLIPPRPLYLAATTGGFAAAGTFYLRLYFTTIQLKDSDYFELLETYRYFN